MTRTRVVDRYEPLLGTVVEVRIVLDGPDRHDEAAALSTAIADEIVRLQSILSSIDPTSEFSRWCRGEVDRPSPELTTVLALAADWQRRSGGRFNPATGALTAAWRAAESSGREPHADDLARIVADIARPRWDTVDGQVQRRGDATDCTLNAVAKGWIADRAVDFADTVDGLALVAVNAGGDIAVRGPGALDVGIEDPATPWDNAPPLAVVELCRCGLATSGSARRGFDIGTRRSHVLDPRTGRPVDGTASISVVAPTTAEADALATMLGVDTPEAAIVEAAALDVACLVVTADGRRLATEPWRRLERPVS